MEGCLSLPIGSLLLSILFTSLTTAQIDLTRTPGASGRDVVTAVIGELQSLCILSQDRQILQRIAYVGTTDGTDSSTYRPGYHGGIWQVDESMLNATLSCSGPISNACQVIKQNLSIDWSSVTWSDLRKPLYSGIAASLYILLNIAGDTNRIPADLTGQGSFWAKWFYNGLAPANKNFALLGPQATMFDCNRDTDLAFILDSSGSIADSAFQLSLNFTAEVVSVMNVPNTTRVAVLIFDSSPDLKIAFGTNTTKDQLINAIRNIRRNTGGTATDLALDYARNQIFPYARPDANKVVVLVTDGVSNSFSQTVLAAQRLRNEAAVNVFAVGVGNYDLKELRAVSSDPVCTHVFTLKQFVDIDNIVPEIQKSTCQAHLTVIKGAETVIDVPPGQKTTTTPVTVNPTPKESLVVTVECGTLIIYISYTNPNPNAAFYSYKFTAADGRPAYVVPAEDFTGQPVYVTIYGTRLSDYEATVQQCLNFRIRIKLQETGWRVRCCLGTQCRPCTREDYLREPGIQDTICNKSAVAQPNLSSLPNGAIRLPANYSNPCGTEKNILFAYTPDKSKFIQCDEWGNAWLVSCPGKEIWNQNAQVCTANPQGPSANPCTAEALRNNIFFHADPCDHTRFLQCDATGAVYVKVCQNGLYFNPTSLACDFTDVQPVSENCGSS